MKTKHIPKRILLIEDNEQHAKATSDIIAELSDMYIVDYNSFLYLPQNGVTPDKHYVTIREYLTENVNTDKFDILMIDMLLGGDSSDSPLGLKMIKEFFKLLTQKKKKIIVYTEMSSSQLDLVKEYNKTVNNSLKIVAKPSNFNMLNNKVDCSGTERKKMRETRDKICQFNRCSYKEKLICDMKCIYYELEGDS